jgi:hypothetical protein
MKAFIISFNRLTPLKAMCEFLTQTGVEPVIIDNASTYPPLLEWLADCPYEVHLRPTNGGHLVLWRELPHLITERYYIVTDPDLDLSSIPHDYVEHLMKGLRMFPHVSKAGLSLDIFDLPLNAYTREVIDWERKFWDNKKGEWYLSDIDTTLAMYDNERKLSFPPDSNQFFSAVRSAKCICKHLPWYNIPETMTEEEKYYLEHTGTYWAEKYKELI